MDDPVKVWGRRQTQFAVKKGLIQKRPCEVCGSPDSDAHHEDYRRPLEVRWLCRLHHMHEHHKMDDVA